MHVRVLKIDTELDTHLSASEVEAEVSGTAASSGEGFSSSDLSPLVGTTASSG